jgi:hypothetical protein
MSKMREGPVRSMTFMTDCSICRSDRPGSRRTHHCDASNPQAAQRAALAAVAVPLVLLAVQAVLTMQAADQPRHSAQLAVAVTQLAARLRRRAQRLRHSSQRPAFPTAQSALPYRPRLLRRDCRLARQAAALRYYSRSPATRRRLQATASPASVARLQTGQIDFATGERGPLQVVERQSQQCAQVQF